MARAAQLYQTWVAQGKGVKLWDAALQQQIHLGDDACINRMQSLVEPSKKNAPDIPIRQRKRSMPLEGYFQHYTDRDEAIARAYRDDGYTMAAIAKN